MLTKEKIKEKIGLLAYYYEAYSCSEGTLRILSDIYNTLLPPELLRMGSINRGGACVDGRCGILESTMLFLSYVYGRKNPEEDYSRLTFWVEKIHDVFHEAMQGYTCKEIWYPIDEKIQRGEFTPHTHCIIYEGLVAISDVVYDAYMDLAENREPDEMEQPIRFEKCGSLVMQARKYTEQGYLCSEVAIRAMSDEFDIPMTEEQRKIGTAYQSGGAYGDRCGVAEVMLLMLSYKYGRMDSREMNLQDRMLSRKLHTRIVEKFGSDSCGNLLAQSQGNARSCPVMEEILAIAEELMKEADTIIKKELDSFVV